MFLKKTGTTQRAIELHIQSKVAFFICLSRFLIFSDSIRSLITTIHKMLFSMSFPKVQFDRDNRNKKTIGFWFKQERPA